MFTYLILEFFCLFGFLSFLKKKKRKKTVLRTFWSSPPTLNRITDHRDSRFDSQFHNRCNLYLLRKTQTCSRQTLGVKVHNSTARKTNKQIKNNSSELVVDAERTGKFGGPWVKKRAAWGHDCLALNRSWKRQERPQRCRIIFARAAELDPGGLALTAAAGHPPTRRPAWPHRLKRKRGEGAASLFLCHFTKMSQSRKDAAEAEARSDPQEEQGSRNASPLPPLNRRNQAVNKPCISALKVIAFVWSGKYKIFFFTSWQKIKEQPRCWFEYEAALLGGC